MFCAYRQLFLKWMLKLRTRNISNFQWKLTRRLLLFKGYSLHLRMHPVGNDHLLLGVGTYAMDMLDVMVNLNEMNKEEGWEVRLNQGYSFFTEHHFSEVNRKWFVMGRPVSSSSK